MKIDGRKTKPVNKITLNCEQCGGEFKRFPSQIGPCCSRPCMLAYTRFQISEQRKESFVARFWSKVVKTTSCWMWNGKTIPNGYGIFSVPGGGKKQEKAHRIAWSLHFGIIPEGCFVCHRCDVPLCVNPDHLFLGTPKDNTKDMIKKKRGWWQNDSIRQERNRKIRESRRRLRNRS